MFVYTLMTFGVETVIKNPEVVVRWCLVKHVVANGDPDPCRHMSNVWSIELVASHRGRAAVRHNNLPQLNLMK